MTTADPPHRWTLSPLEDLADATLGKTPRRADYRDKGRHRIVKYRDLKSGALDLSQTKDAFVADDPDALKNLRRLESGDVLIGASGHDGATVGRKLALVTDLPSDGPTYFVGELFRIRSRTPEISSRWFLHYFSSPEGYRALQTAVTGGHLTNGRARQILVPIAPPDVQREIVDLLDATRDLETSSLAHLSAARGALGRFRRGVLTAASCGRLTADWREANSDQMPSAKRLVSTLRRDAPASRRQLSSGSVGLAEDLPAGWQSALGFEVFAFVTSGSRGWAKYYSDSGPLFLRVGNLDHDSIRLDVTETQHVRPPANAETKRTLVRPNDLLISITAEVGMVAVAPADMTEAYVNQHVAIARPHPAIDSRYVAIFVAARDGGQMQLESLQRGATKAGLGLDDIRSLVIPLPSPAEQVEIVRRVDRLFALANQLERRTNLASEQITRASEAVVAKAFRGELSLNGHGVVSTKSIGSPRK